LILIASFIGRFLSMPIPWVPPATEAREVEDLLTHLAGDALEDQPSRD